MNCFPTNIFQYSESLVLTSRPSTILLCVNALLYLAQDNSVFDKSLLNNLTHYNSALENYVL